jgi:hypothetical protein
MLVSRTKYLFALRRAGIHAFAAVWPGADQAQPAEKIGCLQGNFLCNQTTDREAQHVDLFEPERIDEGDRVGAHLFECLRDLA